MILYSLLAIFSASTSFLSGVNGEAMFFLKEWVMKIGLPHSFLSWRQEDLNFQVASASWTHTSAWRCVQVWTPSGSRRLDWVGSEMKQSHPCPSSHQSLRSAMYVSSTLWWPSVGRENRMWWGHWGGSNTPSPLPRGGNMWTMERSYSQSHLNSLLLAHIYTEWQSLRFSRERGGISTFLLRLLSKLYCQDDCYFTQCNICDLGPCAVPDAWPDTVNTNMNKTVILTLGSNLYTLLHKK